MSKWKIALVLSVIVLVVLVLWGFKLIKKDTANPSSSPSDSSKVTKTATGSKYSFEEVSTTKIDGASIWLFAVPDDKEKMVLSTEDNGTIKMGFFDLDNPQKSVNWKTVVSQSDIGGKRVADHWHEFKNGYHWISFSISEADTGYLMKVDRDLNRVKLVKAVEKEQLSQADLPPNAPNNNNNMSMPTNDMFLVTEDNGVSVGFFLPGKGHRVFQFDSDLNFKSKTDIGGGDYRHGNGSSAIETTNGFDLLASESINHLQEGFLNLIKFDNKWSPKSVTTLVNDKGKSIGMTSGLYLDDGSLIINARVNENAYSQEEMLQKAPPGTASDDGANIERFHFDASGNLISTVKIYEGTAGHRPHTSKVKDKLITTWDVGAYLRIDKIIEK